MPAVRPTRGPAPGGSGMKDEDGERGCSKLAFHGGGKHETLQARDAFRGREKLRAALCAAHLRVTRVATGVAGDRSETFVLRDVTDIVRERPCAIERRRAKVIRIPGNDVARAVAHA